MRNISGRRVVIFAEFGRMCWKCDVGTLKPAGRLCTHLQPLNHHNIRTLPSRQMDSGIYIHSNALGDSLLTPMVVDKPLTIEVTVKVLPIQRHSRIHEDKVFTL